MRDAGPFVSQRIINDKILTVINLVQIPITAAQNIRQQWLSLFHHLVGLMLKVSKQGLTVQSGADIIQLVAEQQCFFGIGPAIFIQISKEQLLVYSGSHFGTKDAVV